MNKEELIQFLKENLSIRISRDWNDYGDGDNITLKVILELDQEPFSSDTFQVPRN